MACRPKRRRPGRKGVPLPDPVAVLYESVAGVRPTAWAKRSKMHRTIEGVPPECQAEFRHPARRPAERGAPGGCFRPGSHPSCPSVRWGWVCSARRTEPRERRTVGGTSNEFDHGPVRRGGTTAGASTGGLHSRRWFDPAFGRRSGPVVPLLPGKRRGAAQDPLERGSSRPAGMASPCGPEPLSRLRSRRRGLP